MKYNPKKIVKLRRSWSRNPGEQVVRDVRPQDEDFDPRKTAREALSELEEIKDEASARPEE